MKETKKQKIESKENKFVITTEVKTKSPEKNC